MTYIFTDFFYHLFSLDIVWIFAFLLNNLFWVFAFLAVAFFFSEGKKWLAMFFMVVAVCWMAYDFPSIVGWVFYLGPILALAYVIRLSVLTFSEYDAVLQNYLRIFWVLLYVVILVGVNTVFKFV